MKGNHNKSFFLKNTYVFLFLRKGLKLLWCVRDGDGDRETKIDCYIDP